MRRRDKEIKDEDELLDIFYKNNVCRLALAVDNEPYLVTMSYGYRNGILYFHCAKKGRKLEMLKKNNLVCFEIDDSYSLVGEDTACTYTASFRSIVGYGRIVVVENTSDKIDALNLLMNQHTGKEKWTYEKEMLSAVTILQLKIDSYKGKKNNI